MTREEAIANLNMISVAFVEPVTKEQRKLINDTFDMAIKALSQEPCDTYTEGCFKGYDDGLERKLEEPCETCGYAEGSPFCLQYCPYDAERKKEQEPCEDAISREAVKDWFCTNYCSEHNQCEHFKQGDCNAMIELFAIPSVTHKSGKWITDRCDMYICSKCNHTYTDLSGERYGMNFCPNCGAKMESEEQTE